MSRNVAKRIQDLKARRTGLDRLDRVAMESRAEVIATSGVREAWQDRQASNPYTQYALGAMQEVGERYTEISIETALRVGEQLKTRLTNAGFSVDFRLQGSVPLNVHIRGVSDVDLLTIVTIFLTYTAGGVRDLAGAYTPSTDTSVGTLARLRNACEEQLRVAFPAVNVDTSGNKAIALSGGSLPRPVDVVPSHWHDDANYQQTLNEFERGVYILDKSVPTTIKNYPFLHIHRVGQRDDVLGGGLRKAIRLCKNIKADAINEGRDIAFSSFDIASALFHCDLNALARGRYNELAILAEVQRHFEFLSSTPASATELMVPDASRKIFDSTAKLAGLRSLLVELDDLVREVAKEQNASLRTIFEPRLNESREVLASAQAV